MEPSMRANATDGIIAIDHVQVTVPMALEGAAKRLYGEVLGLSEIAKPDALKARGGAWYALGEAQFHLAVEADADGRGSRRHVCFRAAGLEEEIDLRAPAQDRILLVVAPVLLDVGFGEIDQPGDLLRPQTFDTQEMTVLEAEVRAGDHERRL